MILPIWEQVAVKFVDVCIVWCQVKRCGEMARKLRYFHDQIAKAGQTPAYRPMLDADVDLDELESKLTDLEAELLEITANTDKLQRTHSELTELQLVLQKVRGVNWWKEARECCRAFRVAWWSSG